jgi:hypothetical protein
VRQEPPAGTPLPMDGPCRLWCQSDPAASRPAPGVVAYPVSARKWRP